MFYKTIPNKHIKTLNRRLEYLESLRTRDEVNSYDLAEIAALREAIDCLEFVRSNCEVDSEETHV